MNAFDAFIIVFSTWRIANFLANESGPGDIGGWLRSHLGVNEEGSPINAFGEMIVCTWCNSYWVGIACLLVWAFLPAPWFYILLGPFALSGASILLGRIING